MRVRATGPSLRHRSIPALFAIASMLAACGSAPPPLSTASFTESPSSHASASPCPNPHGGECLGELGAGTYTTQLFDTALTYTVADGWRNFEDLPGNFLLVPPTASLEGVDAGTAEYLGMYDGIAVASADCFERAQSGVERTPEAMAAWFVAHPGLESTEPTAVTVGGLEGLVIDVWLADDYIGTCPYAQPEGAPLVPMIIGASPAEVHHVAVGETVTRLYLLAGQRGRVLAIELSDVPGGAELEELDAVVGDFVFSIEG